MLRVKRVWCHLMHRRYWKLAIVMNAGYPTHCLVVCAKCDKSIINEHVNTRAAMADWFEKAMR